MYSDLRMIYVLYLYTFGTEHVHNDIKLLSEQCITFKSFYKGSLIAIRIVCQNSSLSTLLLYLTCQLSWNSSLQ